MMKNKTPYIVIAIAFILFNVIAFAIPTEKASVFWIGYVFTVVAFAVQAFVWHLTIGKKLQALDGQSAHILDGVIARHNDIHTRQTAHRPNIDNVFLRLRISKPCSH